MDISEQDFLEHYGVKGMRWGVRRDRPSGVPRATSRLARKDAREHARASAYYGEGAGVRRRLINKTVEQRKKNDPAYAKAFDHHREREDMADAATKAHRKRKRTDRADTAKKSGGYLARKFTGEMGTKAAVTAVVIAGGKYLSSPRGQAQMKRTVSTLQNKADDIRRSQGAKHIQDWLKKQADL